MRPTVAMAALVCLPLIGAAEIAHADIRVPDHRPRRPSPKAPDKTKSPKIRKPLSVGATVLISGSGNRLAIPRRLVHRLWAKDRARRRPKSGSAPLLPSWTGSGPFAGLGLVLLLLGIVLTVGGRQPRESTTTPSRLWGSLGRVNKRWLMPAGATALVVALVWAARVEADAAAYEEIKLRQPVTLTLTDGPELRAILPQRSLSKECRRHAR